MATKITEILSGKEFADPKERVTSLELSLALKEAGVNAVSKYYSSIYVAEPICETDENIKLSDFDYEDFPVSFRYTADELRQILEWLSNINPRIRQLYRMVYIYYSADTYFLDSPLLNLPPSFGSEADALATLLLDILKQLNNETNVS